MLADNNFPQDVFEEVAWQSWSRRGRALWGALAQLTALWAPSGLLSWTGGSEVLNHSKPTITCTSHCMHSLGDLTPFPGFLLCPYCAHDSPRVLRVCMSLLCHQALVICSSEVPSPAVSPSPVKRETFVPVTQVRGR